MIRKKTALNLHLFMEEVKKRMDEEGSTTIKITATDFCDVLGLKTNQYYVKLAGDMGILKKVGPSLYEVNLKQIYQKTAKHYFIDKPVCFIQDADGNIWVSVDSIAEIVNRNICGLFRQEAVSFQGKLFIPFKNIESYLLTLTLSYSFTKKERDILQRFRFWLQQLETDQKGTPSSQTSPRVAANKTPRKKKSMKSKLEQEERRKIKEEFAERVGKMLQEFVAN